LPFGYWRQHVRRFSPGWFLAVHLPVPFIVGLRIYSGLGWHWTTYPFLVAAYFSGQMVGARTHLCWVRLPRDGSQRRIPPALKDCPSSIVTESDKENPDG